MVQRLQNFIHENRLDLAGKHTLLAVSGGVDSMVLCHLFKEAGLPFSIAHCNFQLRGGESEAAEIFVKKQASVWGVPFFSIRFETEQFAFEHSLSIQMAARQLRYAWLEKTRTEQYFQAIATAHHLDDSIETALYNFTKGCGIRGLHGILPKQGRLIRPMLFATKKEVMDYAETQGIAFREDSSNASDKYARNKIRHHVVPVLESLNPAFKQSAAGTLLRLRDAEALYDFALKNIREVVLTQQGDECRIDLSQLLSYPAPATVLFELVKPLGFNARQAEMMLQSADNQSGSRFFSETHRAVFDRTSLIFRQVENPGKPVSYTLSADQVIHLPEGTLTLQTCEAAPAYSESPFEACFDLEKLSFPLLLRRWQAGDVFQPFGMGGKHQKLQDFFTHKKLSRFDKEQVWLLESAGEICWVAGMRPDERFKVGQASKLFLTARFEPRLPGEEKLE